jgi:hypothetical protein
MIVNQINKKKFELIYFEILSNWISTKIKSFIKINTKYIKSIIKIFIYN